MATPTLEDLRTHPDLMGVLYARARRARAQAIHDAAVRLFAALRGTVGGRSRPVTTPYGARWSRS